MIEFSEMEIRFRANLIILNSEFSIDRKHQAMKELLEIYNKQQKEIEELKRLHINIQGMRSGKELLIKYVNDSIPKDKIRERIKELEKEKEGNPDFATIQAIILDYLMLLGEE